MAKRSSLWLTWDTGSNNSVAGTQSGTPIDGQYLAQAAAEFKGTILAVKGMGAVAQDLPSNAQERFAFGIRVRDKQQSLTDVDLFDDVTKAWLWRVDGYLNGAAGDATGLANLMSNLYIPIDARSKRLVTYSQDIVFNWKTSGVAKFGFSGRMLLLEA